MTPNRGDNIMIGSGGAMMYQKPDGITKNTWDGVPVRLNSGENYEATGNYTRNANVNWIEVYVYRRKGSGTIYQTSNQANGGFDNVWKVISFQGANKVVQETTWLMESETFVILNNANTGNEPDQGTAGGTSIQEKTQIESELEKLVYSVNPNQPRHTKLEKGSDGIWKVSFANGQTIHYKEFIDLPAMQRLTLTTSKLATGLANDPGPTSKDGEGKIPVWAYVAAGFVLLTGFGLIGFNYIKKKKR